MALANLFKSSMSHLQYVLANGQVIMFQNGQFWTTDADVIKELEANVKARHPHIYIDENETTIDTDYTTPQSKRDRQIRIEMLQDLAKHTDGSNNLGNYIQDQLSKLVTSAGGAVEVAVPIKMAPQADIRALEETLAQHPEVSDQAQQVINQQADLIAQLQAALRDAGNGSVTAALVTDVDPALDNANSTLNENNGSEAGALAGLEEGAGATSTGVQSTGNTGVTTNGNGLSARLSTLKLPGSN